MSSISAAEQWLSHVTGGHPVLVPALILTSVVIFLALVADFLVSSFVHPFLEKLGLRNRARAVKSSHSTRSAVAAPEGQVVIVSPSGQCFFTLLPGRSGRGPWTEEPFGRAYRLQRDGQIRELWRVEGWYSFHECFLSDDGRYLVRVVEVARDDLTIAFYDRGDLLRQFSVSDLVGAEISGLGSMSRGRGLDEPTAESSWPIFELSAQGDNTFRMITTDRVAYAFDVTTGEIIPAEVRPEPRGIGLRKAMLVGGACVAAAGVGVLLARSRRAS